MERVDGGCSILLVDNEQDMAARIAALYDGDNGRVSVSQVERLREALQLLRMGIAAGDVPEERRPDLILLNLSLPDCAGLAGLQRILRYGADIPLIVLTSRLSVGHGPEALKLGAKHYISKSALSAEFLDRCLQNGPEAPSAPAKLGPSPGGVRARRSSLDDVDRAVYGCRADGTIATWNAVAEKAYGWESRNAKGRNVA